MGRVSCPRCCVREVGTGGSWAHAKAEGGSHGEAEAEDTGEKGVFTPHSMHLLVYKYLAKHSRVAR